MAEMTIGEAAAASGVKITTIRFYEDRGLVSVPPRTAAGRRLYDPAAVARLRFIRHARDLGFDLEAITALLSLADLPDTDCAAADSIARRQLGLVRQRIAQLSQLAAELERMVATCSGGRVADCQVIESLADHTLCEAPHPQPADLRKSGVA